MIEQTELPGDVMKTAQEIAVYVGGTINGNAQVVSSRNYSVHSVTPQFSSGANGTLRIILSVKH